MAVLYAGLLLLGFAAVVSLCFVIRSWNRSPVEPEDLLTKFQRESAEKAEKEARMVKSLEELREYNHQCGKTPQREPILLMDDPIDPTKPYMFNDD
ncbi:hypothetical protein L4X63_09500 [Geomonas sp. Red32]|uniref:hypothetical protein n=1 Tax=Geomonas sp. Red32 TaxID=2912856 RepID=UPI00202CCD59|nr:hypothetical protein [Geomonas sp. Red32]MCM0081823.1 hypothetical protein [Geomonas sp. Red32]